MASCRSGLHRVYGYFCAVSLVFVGYLVSLTDGSCGRIILSGKTGELKTPNYPKTYPSYSRCSWLIQAPPGYKIKLQFYHFVLEDSYQCMSDYVKIYDGRNSSATPLGVYCGRHDPFYQETTRNNMFIEFRSDRSLNTAGFRAKFLTIALQPPRELSFKRTLRNTTHGVVGKQVRFQCQVKGGGLDVVFSWVKDGKELSSDGLHYIIKYNAQTGRSILLLPSVSASDAGVYGCLASDADSGKNISTYGSLQLKEGAALKVGPSPMHVYADQTVIVKCVASGDPVPKISWQVNGVDKTDSAIQKNFSSELHFKAMEDAVVNCTADNGVGIDWKTGNISVLAPVTLAEVTDQENPTTSPSKKSSPPMITLPPANTTAELGGNVTLTCATTGNPKPKIRWLAEDKYYEDLPEDDKGVSHFTLIVSKERTKVRCEAQNIHNIDKRTAFVTVPNAPVTLAEVTDQENPTTSPSKKSSPPMITLPPANTTAELGGNVTLTCAATGNPKPKIRWLAEDKYYEDLPEDDKGVSHFTLIVSKERTKVRCEAQNIHNIDKRTAFVTVPNVEAVVEADSSSGIFGQMAFILIISFVALAVLVILIVGLILHRRRNLKSKHASTPVDLEKLQKNPIYEQQTNYYVNPELLSWAVPRNTMEFIKELGPGNGNFSSLFLGSISEVKTDAHEEKKLSLVMVKLLKEKYKLEAEQENFEKDAIALTTFSHPYVQSLFGVCVDGLPLCLVFEFSEHDECLQQFLIESGRGQCSIHRRADLQSTKPKLSNIDQISMAKQIANGMEYLADKGYVHRELCTKNCIIGKGMIVKISNLGFSWKGPNTDYFSLAENEKAGYPVRWLPPETIMRGTFKEETDIWSFGVVLWEIYSSGLTPYYGMNDVEVISLVEGGDTLPCPKECPNEMYEVMQACWSMNPTERPRFNSIYQRISSLFNGVPV